MTVTYRLSASIAALACLAAITFLLPAHLGSSPAEAAHPGANGEIAFQRDSGEEGLGLVAVRADGSGLRDVFLGEGFFGVGEPAYSPDGETIVFVGAAPDGFHLYSVGADGADLRRITPSGGEDRSPDFSPDGSKVVFSSDRAGFSDIWTGNADGNGLTQLTFGGAFPKGSPLAAGGGAIYVRADHSPAWSADGTIYFVSNRAGALISVGQETQVTSDIWAMNADGTGLRQLTRTPLLREEEPDPSPDGTEIAFQRLRGGNFDVYVIDANGTNTRRLTSSSSFDGKPAFSPDGELIAFESMRRGGTTVDTLVIEVFVMNADGSGERPVLAGTRDATPSWQPLPGSAPPTTFVPPDVKGPPGAPRCHGKRATIVGSDLSLGDLIVGTEAADVIHARKGPDTVRGLGGDDVICAGKGDDRVFAGDGADLVRGGSGRDRLRGAEGDDSIVGGAARDLIYGGPGDDSLRGQRGRDRLTGGPGDDRLIGGSHRDKANGGAGTDVCRAEVTVACP
ncbi:MAG: hypothetical protein ACR2OD_05915 [Gaiellaceae bacterium]